MHAVDEGTTFREGRLGFSDVLCGNGNFCGRNTSGPGMCSKSMSNFTMGTIVGKGFPQAQVHTVHSTSAIVDLLW